MSISRRRLTTVALLGGLASCAATVAVVLLTFLWPDAELPPTTMIDESFLPGAGDEPYAFQIGDAKACVALVPHESDVSQRGTLVAVLRQKPGRCTVAWRPDGFSWRGERFANVYRDPCRGTIFDLAGRYVFGHPSADLTRLVVDVIDDGDARVSFPSSALATAP